MVDRDQSGGFAQRARQYRGSTLGWVEVDIAPERIVTANTTVGAGDCVILLNAAGLTIQLPNVVTWVRTVFGDPLTSFDRALEIADYAGLAATTPHTILPFGTQKISQQSSWSISGAFGVLRIRPLTDLSGWYAV